MPLDLKLTGGTIVDGTGGAPYRADVGVKDGRIVEIGPALGAAQRILDAEGAIVTPGFTDIHAHYDGQASWDGDLAPSSLHGVTTCVMGNCGVGFAPARPADRARLVELMEGVEDIPGTALSEGLTWRWESFAEYLEEVDRVGHAIDVVAQVPHDALRVYVMGERAIASEAATEDDIARMRTVLREALVAGAAGFSTGRTDNHRTARGHATPASEATARELVGLATAFEGLGHGVLQAVSDFDAEADPARFDREFDVLQEMAAATGGRPLSISLMERGHPADPWRRIVARAEQADRQGVPIRLQVAPRAIGVLLGLEASFQPFMGFPSYKRIAALPLPERLQAMAAPDFRRRLLAEKSEPVAGDGSPIPPLADRLLANLDMLSFRIFRLGERPDYEPRPESSIGAAARQAGITPREALLDALVEGGGRELLYFPIFNFGSMNLDMCGEMLSHPLALPGLGDGGAHVGFICDASFPTFLLSHWVRDRAHGRIPLAQAVKMLAHDTARYVGLHDRGTVALGHKADLNVVVMDELRLLRPRLVADLPAGGKRLLQDAVGIRATIVSGKVIAEGGRLTGARPGRVVRLGLDRVGP